MFLLRNKENQLVVYISETLAYVKVNKDTYEFEMCAEDDATHIFDSTQNMAWFRDDTNLEISFADELPYDFAVEKYFYRDGEFILNENWHEPEPYVPIEQQVKNLSLALANQILINESLQRQILIMNSAFDELLTEILPSLMGGEE